MTPEELEAARILSETEPAKVLREALRLATEANRCQEVTCPRSYSIEGHGVQCALHHGHEGAHEIEGAHYSWMPRRS